MSTETTTKTQAEEIQQKGFRNFRTNVDVENFYRFVHENDLRREAKILLDHIFSRTKKGAKKQRRKSARKLQ